MTQGSEFHKYRLLESLLMMVCHVMWCDAVFVTYVMSGLGITAGAHRLWAHRSYCAKMPLRFLLAMFNSMAFQVRTSSSHWTCWNGRWQSVPAHALEWQSYSVWFFWQPKSDSRYNLCKIPHNRELLPKTLIYLIAILLFGYFIKSVINYSPHFFNHPYSELAWLLIYL